jgi:hypothetical protein
MPFFSDAAMAAYFDTYKAEKTENMINKADAYHI